MGMLMMLVFLVLGVVVLFPLILIGILFLCHIIPYIILIMFVGMFAGIILGIVYYTLDIIITLLPLSALILLSLGIVYLLVEYLYYKFTHK